MFKTIWFNNYLWSRISLDKLVGCGICGWSGAWRICRWGFVIVKSPPYMWRLVEYENDELITCVRVLRRKLIDSKVFSFHCVSMWNMYSLKILDSWYLKFNLCWFTKFISFELWIDLKGYLCLWRWCTRKLLDGLIPSPKVKAMEGEGVGHSPWLVAFCG